VLLVHIGDPSSNQEEIEPACRTWIFDRSLPRWRLATAAASARSSVR
jgi:hypothetical protein